MRFQMGGIDHQLIRLARLRRQACKDLVEHAHPAPTHEPVVDRLGRTVLGRRIAPAQAVTNYKDDAANDPTIIDPRNSMRQWKLWLNPAHLHLRQPDQITHGNASSALPLNQIIVTTGIPLIGPEPRSMMLQANDLCRAFACLPDLRS